MHKKRGILVAALVLIIVLSMVLMASNHYYYKNAKELANALKVMNIDPEEGYNLCGQLRVKEYAIDCYTTYMSARFVEIGEANQEYNTLEGEEKRESGIRLLNELSEVTEKTCNIDVMKDTDACNMVTLSLEDHKQKLLIS